MAEPGVVRFRQSPGEGGASLLGPGSTLRSGGPTARMETDPREDTHSSPRMWNQNPEGQALSAAAALSSEVRMQRGQVGGPPTPQAKQKDV